MAFKQQYDLEKKRFLSEFMNRYTMKFMGISHKRISEEELKAIIKLVCSLSKDSDMEKEYFWQVFNNSQGLYKDCFLFPEDSVISSLDSSDEKMRLFDVMKSYGEKLLVAKNEKNEKMRLKFFIKTCNENIEKGNMINAGNLGAEIVAGFSSKEFKQYLARILRFSDETIKKYGLLNDPIEEHEYKHNNWRGEIDVDYVLSLKSVEERIKLIDRVNKYYKYKVLASLPPLEVYDGIKIEYLEDKKIKNIADIYNNYHLLVLSLSDKAKDSFMEASIEIVKDKQDHWAEQNENIFSIIAASFQSDELKQKYRQYVKNCVNELRIVSALGYYDEEEKPRDVITSINDLDDSTRKDLAYVVEKVWNYSMYKNEELGIERHEAMMEERKKLLELVEENMAEKHEMERIIGELASKTKPQGNIEKT